jgi:hypothetical protein
MHALFHGDDHFPQERRVCRGRHVRVDFAVGRALRGEAHKALLEVPDSVCGVPALAVEVLRARSATGVCRRGRRAYGEVRVDVRLVDLVEEEVALVQEEHLSTGVRRAGSKRKARHVRKMSS